nr:MAG TPA: hypothetical protein [Caudoviricetes sp.]
MILKNIIIIKINTILELKEKSFFISCVCIDDTTIMKQTKL